MRGGFGPQVLWLKCISHLSKSLAFNPNYPSPLLGTSVIYLSLSLSLFPVLFSNFYRVRVVVIVTPPCNWFRLLNVYILIMCVSVRSLLCFFFWFWDKNIDQSDLILNFYKKIYLNFKLIIFRIHINEHCSFSFSFFFHGMSQDIQICIWNSCYC